MKIERQRPADHRNPRHGRQRNLVQRSSAIGDSEATFRRAREQHVSFPTVDDVGGSASRRTERKVERRSHAAPESGTPERVMLYHQGFDRP